MKGIGKIIFFGVSDLAPDYIALAKAFAGEDVEITSDRSMQISGNPNEQTRVFPFFSTSTFSVPDALKLAAKGIEFGVVEHSPTDGSTLCAWLFTPDEFRELWNPAQGLVEPGMVRQAGAGDMA